MAMAIDTAYLALNYIPRKQRELDRKTGGQIQIHRISAYATIVSCDSEIWRQLYSPGRAITFWGSKPEQEALDWQPDPDTVLIDAAVLHHLHRQAATVPLLSSVISQTHHGNAATTLTGSALSASINARTQGRPLSSFHRHSYRIAGCKISKPPWGCGTHFAPTITEHSKIFDFEYGISDLSPFIAWEGPPSDGYAVLWQLQIDVINLCSWRNPTSRPGKRQRTAVNQFQQVSDSPAVADTSRGNALPHARKFNGVRHRPDRRTWVAEMKPPKHKTKQDFGNFKSEAEAARAVDAAFYHYDRPDLLNFPGTGPGTSLQFLTTRPTAPPELDEKAKVKFVREEAKLLLAASSPAHLTHTNSLQVPESPRRCPSGDFRSLSEISCPFSCSGLHEVDDDVSQSQLRVDLGLVCGIATSGVQTYLENLNSEQNADWGRDCGENSSPLAAPLDVVNSSACEIECEWLRSYIRSPPALTYSRSPSPSHSQEELAYALLEQQSI